MITMIHSNPGRIDGDLFIVDRKFHSGMSNYVEAIGAPILTVHPEAGLDTKVMDPIEVPIKLLPYKVLLTKTCRATGDILPAELLRLRQEFAGTRLLYGAGLGSAKVARIMGIPYILVIEYDFLTQVVFSTTSTTNIFRKIVRAIKVAIGFAKKIPDRWAAHSIHCNGYPVFDESRWFNSSRLLYLDSRMFENQIISPEFLHERLASRQDRPIRLLFSGRYEKTKGAADAVKVALECGKLGLPIEMHCYGQGSLCSEMKQLASQACGAVKINIHDAIPFPELIRIAQTFDLFVCCHIQSDPSCTYLEAFGAGLPVVGYANRMWRRLNEESGIGQCSAIGQPAAVAKNIASLCANPSLLKEMSERARAFAIEHCFEREFQLRTSAIVSCLTHEKL
jgi:colanic acid/amylovoran biosynthesis glycosyltransferase